MLDLFASINDMSYFVDATLKLDFLIETSIVIQLIDLFNAYPMGVWEDVLV